MTMTSDPPARLSSRRPQKKSRLSHKSITLEIIFALGGGDLAQRGQCAPYAKLAVEEMDEREISGGFKKRNILTPHNPNLDIISQENTIITTKCGGRAFLLQSRSRRRHCHQEVT